ncbi:MAG: KTSC domain-containing protein [Gammaproteobacteria bacterium]
MKMQAVRSSTIDVVGYDELTHKMRVCFRCERPKEFCHVPEDIFYGFVNARSKNRYYKRHILNQFPC